MVESRLSRAMGDRVAVGLAVGALVQFYAGRAIGAVTLVFIIRNAVYTQLGGALGVVAWAWDYGKRVVGANVVHGVQTLEGGCIGLG